MNRKILQPRILYSSSLPFRIEGERKVFPNKPKLKEFTTAKPSLQEILRGIPWGKCRKYHKVPQTPVQAWKLQTSQCLGTIAFHNNTAWKWNKCSNQKTQGIRMDNTKQDPSICCRTGDSFQTWGHLTVESGGMENYLSCYWESKGRCISHTYIRQTWPEIKVCSKRCLRALLNNYSVCPSGRGDNENDYAVNSEAHKYLKHLITNINNPIDKNVVIAGGL